jgi:hypothetical protein
MLIIWILVIRGELIPVDEHPIDTLNSVLIFDELQGRARATEIFEKMPRCKHSI